MIKNIIFDFDGVILDAVPTKTEAFNKLFVKFETAKVEKLIEYHLANGGKSRYLKIRYFFEEILNQNISEKEVNQYANEYSRLTKEELSKSKYIIQDTIKFIKENYKKYAMHIASGADENDLIYICNHLNLNQYFFSIHGSPTLKEDLVKTILYDNKYLHAETVLIGDSINDYIAADKNNISFYGFNNILLKEIYTYIDDFNTTALI